MLLAQRGHHVLLLDKASFPRHKACSEYVNAGGVRALRELDLVDDVLAAGAHVMEAMEVHAPGGRIYRADFARAAPGAHALGLSRHRLDALLLDRAKACGVTVCERAHLRRVIEATEAGVMVEATIDGRPHLLHAAILVGADGTHSAVSRSLALDRPARWPDCTGLVAHYRGVTGLDRTGELHVTRGGYAGLAPLEDGLTNVAVVLDTRRVRNRDGSVAELFASTLNAIPRVAARLDGAVRAGDIRGVGSMARRVRRIAGPGYLLVGDAAGFLDPFTGDGIYEGLRGAQLAVPVISDALRRNDCSDQMMGRYRWDRRRVFAARRQVCWIVQGFIHQPMLMDYVTSRLDERETLGQTLTGVVANLRPARDGLSPLFLARLLRP
jgi:flavin-dependent dehydrogenase